MGRGNGRSEGILYGKPLPLRGRPKLREDAVERFGPNTQLDYGYRDGSNFKTAARVILAGAHSIAEIELIKSKLDSGEFFIPSQVGLRDLQEDFTGSVDEQEDHVWHELDELEQRIAATEREPNTALSWKQLVASFAALEHWDEAAAVARVFG